LDALPKTVIVVPCFNEAHRLDAGAFTERVTARPWLHFLFVDDGSTDSTARVLRGLCAARPAQLSVLALPANAGKAEAVRQGVLEATRTDALLTGYWDADLAAPLSEIDRMCELLRRRDAFLVLGARVKLLGRRIERQPARHYLGRAFATCTSLLLDLPVYDTQCGAKVLCCNELTRSIFAEPFITRWVFDVEILARLMQRDRRGEFVARSRVLEHPLLQWIDVGGSRLTRTEWARVGLELLALAARYRLSMSRSA